MNSNQIKLVGMSTVCNEGDILREVLENALQFHDCIYVVDCSSQDNTPQILAEMASQYPSLYFWVR